MPRRAIDELNDRTSGRDDEPRVNGSPALAPATEMPDPRTEGMRSDTPLLSAGHEQVGQTDHPRGATRLAQIEAELNQQNTLQRLFGDPIAGVTLLGRYILQEKIDGGGMGVVFRAIDTKLKHQVALKVLRPGLTDTTERMAREARTMAKIRNDNVIRAYDYHPGDEREALTFLVMEFIAGPTLRAWVSEQSRTWQAIVEKFCGIANGLANAHKAGDAHRDVKPDNILIMQGDQELPVLIDFGLILALPLRTSTNPIFSTGSVTEDALLPRLTRDKDLVGTPGYIAPELLGGGDADARSDQFSFFVTLYEALYHERPFDGEDPPRTAGARRITTPPPGPSRAPFWLRRMFLRGLAADPACRYMCMEAVLRALRRGQVFSLWLPRVLLASPFILLAIVGIVSRMHDPCAGAERVFSGVWDPDIRASVQTGFMGSGAPGAAQAWERLEMGISAYTAQWLDMKRSICRNDTHEGAPHLAAQLREDCLHESLALLRALALRTSHAGIEVVMASPEMLTLLDASLVRCIDLPAVDSTANRGVSPVQATKIRRAQGQLADAAMHELAGDLVEALAAAQTALVVGQDLDFKPLIAEAAFRVGRVQSIQRERDAALAALTTAHNVSIEARHDEITADAAIELIKLYILDFEDRRSAAVLDNSLDAVLSRLPGPQTRRRADRQEVQAMLARLSGSRDDAIRHHRAALELRRSIAYQGPSRDALRSFINLANTLSLADATAAERAEARALYEQALRESEAFYGSQHPRTIEVLTVYATFLEEAGEIGLARSIIDRAVSASIVVFGAYSWQLAKQRLVHAKLSLATDDRTAAQADIDAALPVLAGHVRRDELHSDVITALQLRAEIQRISGEEDAALATYEDALTLLRAMPDDLDAYADTLANSGELLLRRGDHQEALRRLEQARKILRPSRASGQPLDAVLLANLAEAYRQDGRLNESRELAGEAREICKVHAIEEFELLALIERCLPATNTP